MENKVTKRITTPEEAVTALAQAAVTSRQTFCIDEPPLPTLLTRMTWSAEEIALRNNLPASVMDDFYRTVFSEHQANPPTLTRRELRETQAALLDFLGEDNGEDRIYEGIMEWEDLPEAAEDAA
jgi:hypothetical protein